MAKGPFVVGSEARNGRQSESFEPRWWWWSALIGLIVGWVIGLNLKPDLEDLRQAALQLVPPSAEVTEEEVLEKTWILFTPWPPEMFLDIVSESIPEQLAEEFGTQAELSGWEPAEISQGPGAISLSSHSLLLESSVLVWRSADMDHDADLHVWGRDGIGKIVTASASLTGGLLTAIVIGVLTHYRHGEPRAPRHAPLRWWHLLGVAFIAFVFRASLHFIV